MARFTGARGVDLMGWRRSLKSAERAVEDLRRYPSHVVFGWVLCQFEAGDVTWSILARWSGMFLKEGVIYYEERMGRDVRLRVSSQYVNGSTDGSLGLGPGRKGREDDCFGKLWDGRGGEDARQGRVTLMEQRRRALGEVVLRGRECLIVRVGSMRWKDGGDIRHLQEGFVVFLLFFSFFAAISLLL